MSVVCRCVCLFTLIDFSCLDSAFFVRISLCVYGYRVVCTYVDLCVRTSLCVCVYRFVCTYIALCVRISPGVYVYRSVSTFRFLCTYIALCVRISPGQYLYCYVCTCFCLFLRALLYGDVSFLVLFSCYFFCLTGR